jgi:invasion protein IalB
MTMKFLNMRMALLGGVAIIAVAMGLAALPRTGMTQGATPENAQAPASADAWANRCQDLKDGDKVTGQYCETMQSLSVMPKDGDPKAAQRVAEFAVGYPPVAKGKPRGAMILPLGILLEEKPVVEVDGKELFKADVRYCDNNGCIAMFDLSSGQIDRMRKGDTMVLKAKAANGQPLQINMSLKGFGAALDKTQPAKK